MIEPARLRDRRSAASRPWLADQSVWSSPTSPVPAVAGGRLGEWLHWELAISMFTLLVSWFAASIIQDAAHDLDRRVAMRQPGLEGLLTVHRALRHAEEGDAGRVSALAAGLDQGAWHDVLPNRGAVLRPRPDGWLLALEPLGLDSSESR